MWIVKIHFRLPFSFTISWCFQLNELVVSYSWCVRTVLSIVGKLWLRRSTERSESPEVESYRWLRLGTSLADCNCIKLAVTRPCINHFRIAARTIAGTIHAYAKKRDLATVSWKKRCDFSILDTGDTVSVVWLSVVIDVALWTFPD